MKKRPLYINLHIPKTAGYTLRYHIVKNFRHGEHLLLDYEFLGLNLFNPPFKYETYKKNAFNLIKSLTKKEKDKIMIIHGHTVPYGIHELFPDREPRYFTFMRNVVDRTLSIYNHLSSLNIVEGSDPRKKGYYQRYLLIDGKDPGLTNWFRKKYINDLSFDHFSLSGYLKEFGYLTGKINFKTINEALGKFYFVGITENFDSESLYFFSELGMHKFFIDQNISTKMPVDVIDNDLKNEIKLANKFDSYLYHTSISVNSSSKQRISGFQEIVQKKTLEKKLLLPFTQVLFAPRQTFLRLVNNVVKHYPLKSKPTYFSAKFV